MLGGGKVGVVIFFSISTWFFLDKEQTIKSSFKRAWIMERELLFWSIILITFYLIFDRADINSRLIIVKSAAPLTMNLWWYATSYAIFLALSPFLIRGLKALGRKYHLTLAAVTLTIWGLTSFVPETLGDATNSGSFLTGVFGLIYLFIRGWCRFVGLVIDSITTNHAIRPSLRRRSMMLMPNSVLIRLSRYQTM